MQKKKGIVLLITLFFISAISLLILENLNDSEKFINETSYDMKLQQLKISNKNIQNEIIDMLNNNFEKGIVEYTQPIALSFQGISIIINIEYLEDTSCNINKLITNKMLLTLCGEEVYSNISNKDKFIENLKQFTINGNISHQQQLDYFLEQYQKSTNDQKINSIKDSFGYIVKEEESTFVKCTYDIFLDDSTFANSYFIFNVEEANIESSYYRLGNAY